MPGAEPISNSALHVPFVQQEHRPRKLVAEPYFGVSGHAANGFPQGNLEEGYVELTDLPKVAGTRIKDSM